MKFTMRSSQCAIVLFGRCLTRLDTPLIVVSACHRKQIYLSSHLQARIAIILVQNIQTRSTEPLFMDKPNKENKMCTKGTHQSDLVYWLTEDKIK